MSEPHSPWQNTSEHDMNDLGTMTTRNMKEFNVPLNHCHWCMKWCKDAHNVLSVRKLGWRTPKEVLTGDAPDMSVFKFQIWEDMYHLDLGMKQPKHDMLPGNILGITWNHIESSC